MKLGERTILHSDMNCFYASAEVLERTMALQACLPERVYSPSLRLQMAPVHPSGGF